jgi:hypothetical protein
MCTCIYVHACDVSACLSMHVNVCTCTCMHVHVHRDGACLSFNQDNVRRAASVCINACIYMYMCMCVYDCADKACAILSSNRIYALRGLCMYVYVYVCIRVHGLRRYVSQYRDTRSSVFTVCVCVYTMQAHRCTMCVQMCMSSVHR